VNAGPIRMRGGPRKEARPGVKGVPGVNAGPIRMRGGPRKEARPGVKSEVKRSLVKAPGTNKHADLRKSSPEFKCDSFRRLSNGVSCSTAPYRRPPWKTMRWRRPRELESPLI
jgi:hypothetical protein